MQQFRIEGREVHREEMFVQKTTRFGSLQYTISATILRALFFVPCCRHKHLELVLTKFYRYPSEECSQFPQGVKRKIKVILPDVKK
jgi:hypothetical protein